MCLVGNIPTNKSHVTAVCKTFERNPQYILYNYTQHIYYTKPVNSRPATIHFSTIRIRIPIQLSSYDTLHNNKTKRVLPPVLLVGSEICTADKPSWKHACVCCVRHIGYNVKHCSVWIFLTSLFGKSPCRRTKKRKEGEHQLKTAFPCLLMQM